MVRSGPAALFGRLSTLLRNIAPGTNRNDQVMALIAACISEGVVTKREIIAVTGLLGFKRYHVTQHLDYGVGHDRASGLWRRNRDGSYSLFA
ncbi:MAG: hypothetical protein A3E77_01660 [Sphingopyxis sp. RIFCSPHIGHO2_12_FULL_65_19]|nr:MAG: hypothetical protein A3E77_01660 [Sphingopyxis sp. RIFCSPHIGHO2_12_FULL_65_19]